MSERARRALAALEAVDRLRDLRAVEPIDAVTVRLDGRPLKLFSGNDYLGLSSHPAVREASAEAAARHGMGPRGAALVCGYTEAHEALEAELAELKGTEAALLFPTGFQANLSVLSALGQSGTVFSDALNHASIIDGCRLARAEVRVFRHRDLAHLESLLDGSSHPRVIVTDEIFSMSGEGAELAELAALARRWDCTLVTDAAHSTLVYGETGGGWAEACGTRPHFQVGTLSKAVGALGGFVACSTLDRRWLLNVARPFIFTTALPLPVVAAARAAIRCAADGALRSRLWANVKALGAEAPIHPVILGPEAAALEASAALLEAGFHVPAIRPPTVPAGSARLRVALSAAHDEEVVRALRASLPTR